MIRRMSERQRQEGRARGREGEGLSPRSRVERFLRLQRQLDELDVTRQTSAADAALEDLLLLLPEQSPSRGFSGRVLMAAGMAPWWALPVSPKFQRWSGLGLRAAAVVATIQLALIMGVAGALIVPLLTDQGFAGSLSLIAGAAVWLLQAVPDAASFVQGSWSVLRSVVGAAVTPDALLLISVCLTLAFSALYVLSQVVESERSVARGRS